MCSRALVIAAILFIPFCSSAQDRVLPDGVHAGIAFENGGHDTVGPYKFKTFVELNDQLKFGERIKVDGTFSGEIEELQGVSVTYEQPFAQNWLLRLKGASSRTRPGGFIDELFDQKTFDNGGGGSALGSTLGYTYRVNDKLTMVFSGGFEALDVSTEQISKLPGITDRRFTRRTRDLQFSAAFNYIPSQDTGLYGVFGIEQGLDVLDPEDTRENYEETATIFRFNGSFKQNLPNRFQFVLRGGCNSQTIASIN